MSQTLFYIQKKIRLALLLLVTDPLCTNSIPWKMFPIFHLSFTLTYLIYIQLKTELVLLLLLLLLLRHVRGESWTFGYLLDL